MRSILTDDYISICSKVITRFEMAVKDILYQPKGIFNSEMLLVCAIAEQLGVNRIIESGRARGYSTIVLANYFRDENDLKIDSIENSKYTADVVIAMKRLSGIRNVRLLFGDSFKLLTGLVSEEPCVVLIDGPKGRWATLLACMTLRNSNVKAVFIHDMHKISDGRELTEKLFPDVFFTDDKKFVDRFESLDDECWLQQQMYKQFSGWAPYLRGSKIMPSYSSTLAMVVNESHGIDKVEECRQYMRDNSIKRAPISKRIFRKVRSQSKIPYWFVRYHLTKAFI